MITNDDKNAIKRMMMEPGLEIFKIQMREDSNTYRAMAEQPEVEEHYRLILFGKAQGMDEFQYLANKIINK